MSKPKPKPKLPKFKAKKEKLNLLFGEGETGVGMRETVVEIVSDRRISVEGCLGVLKYYDNLISLAIKRGTVCFYGHGLKFLNVSDGCAEIVGRVESIEYDLKSEKSTVGKR